jgi:antirestriction protein ArdC
VSAASASSSISSCRAVEESEQPNENSTDSKRQPFMLAYYNVFNVEQCEGLDVPIIEEPAVTKVALDATCEALVNHCEGRPTIRTEIRLESRAYYRPSTDSVHLPARLRFIDTAHYYKTLFRELIHSTGHESRLARTFGARFGDELYSKEELIAETGAAFLSAIAGVETEHTEQNTTAYIQHWIAALKQDNRLIIQAAAAAQKAVDIIIGESLFKMTKKIGASARTFEQLDSLGVLPGAQNYYHRAARLVLFSFLDSSKCLA